MDRAEILAEIDVHAAELDRMGALLDSGPLGPDLRAELTLLAPRCSKSTTARCR